MLELYHWEPTADSLALLLCLQELGLEFNAHYVDLIKLEQHDADYLAVNARATVPLLVADGECLDDTGLALQYLVEQYPQPVLAPAAAGYWYDLQAWSAWLAGLAADVRLLGWNLVMLNTLAPDQLRTFRQKAAALPGTLHSGWSAVWSDAEANEDQLANARERIGAVIDRLESGLAADGWLIGKDYSISDILAYAHTHTLPRLLPDMVSRDKTPHIIRWQEKIGTRPALQQVMQMKRTALAGDVYVAPAT